MIFLPHKRSEIFKYAKHVLYCKLKTTLIPYLFYLSQTIFEVFRFKKIFLEKVFQGVGLQKRLDVDPNRFEIFVKLGIESPLNRTVEAIFSQN